MNLLLITSTFPIVKKGNAESSFLRLLTPFLYKYFNRVYLLPTIKSNHKFKIFRNKYFLICGNDLFKPDLIDFLNLYIQYFSILIADIKNIPFNYKYFYNFYRTNFVYIKSIFFICYVEKKNKTGIIDLNNLVLYSFWFDDFILGSIFLKIKYKLKLAVSAHGFDLFEFRNKGNYIPFRAYSLANIDIVLPDSHEGRDYLKNKYPFIFSDQKIKIFLPSVCRKTVQSSFSKDGILRLLTISRTHPVKRLEYFMDILKKLENEYTDIIIEWTHIGGGKEYDSLCYKLLKLNFSRFKINLKGITTDFEINRFYRNQSIDYFLNVSSSEGTSLALIEAISYGIPVICTKVGGNIFVAEKCGYLLDVNFNHHDLYEIIKITKSNEDDYRIIRNHSFSTWNKYFNPDINFSNFMSDLLIR